MEILGDDQMDGGRQTAWDSDLDSVSPRGVCDDQSS